MPDVSLTFGCGLYDRMVPLFSGEVKPEGFDLTFVPIDTPGDVFTRMFEGKYQAGEMSCADYLRRTSAGDCPFVAIPVFPSRVFRHSMICVNRHAGIDKPKDLEGKRVGVPYFTMTAALWIRGLLQQDYGVDVRKIVWLQDGAFGPAGADDPTQRAIRAGFTIEANASGKPLETLLDEGAIDAFIGADVPEAMRASPNIRRLFPDYRTVEREYYRRTKIFPIMHTVVIRRDFYDAHPFVARNLFDALERSKDVARRKMRYMGTLRYMLPWMIAEIEELDELFEGDPFGYGLEPNRHTLETALGYLEDQGLLTGPVALDDAFVDVRS